MLFSDTQRLCLLKIILIDQIVPHGIQCQNGIHNQIDVIQFEWVCTSVPMLQLNDMLDYADCASAILR